MSDRLLSFDNLQLVEIFRVAKKLPPELRDSYLMRLAAMVGPGPIALSVRELHHVCVAAARACVLARSADEQRRRA